MVRRCVCLFPVLATLVLRSSADIDNIFPIIWASNPVARHVACSVPAGSPTVCQLASFEASGRDVNYLITTLPSNGNLYETSQNYRTYGTAPYYAATPLQVQQLPYQITDPLARVVYVPPSDVFPPDGSWDALSYTVQEPISGNGSQSGELALCSPSGNVAASTFIGGVDSWTIAGNIINTVPTWEAFGWGLLNRYIYGTDEVQYIDFSTGNDRSKWYFEAPAGNYYVPELATAYGGILQFTIASTYGDFTHLNSPLDFITLECATCNSGRGLRIIRYADNGLQWDGSQQIVRVTLSEGNFWIRDPKNSALAFTDATQCEIAAVLAGLTRFAILGDFTQAGEGVAVDDVMLITSPSQPAFPITCQQGCSCAHYPVALRLSCCGSNPNIYYPI